jgi:tetratricopeptide (TPR) repeat protein
VALGLQWLTSNARTSAEARRAERTKAPSRAKAASPRPLTIKDVRAHLAALPADALVEIVMQQALEDDALRQRLLLDAAKGTSSGVKLHTYRLALADAIGTGRFVHFRETAAYFSQIHQVIASIDELGRKEPLAVIELVEHALRLMEQAMDHIDDSAGHSREVLERLHALHLAACTQARPEPVALAQRLFEREMASEWEIFHDSARRYAKTLGAKGLARYRALAEEAWARVPPLGPGDHGRTFEGKRFRITSIMESLARLSNDVDAIAAVKARDLSSAYSYLQIAELYQQAGHSDRAMEWAEQGVAAFPTRTDGRLRTFLAAQYRTRGRVAEALGLLWLNFQDHPSLPDYATLHAVAAPAGQWVAWRERALAVVRGGIARRGDAAPRAGFAYGADGSLLVEILLWEGDADAAWNEAKVSGCNDTLSRRLAQGREVSHPDDAVAVYQRLLEHILSRAKQDAYREAVAALRHIARVMKRGSSLGGFGEYLARVRTRHKAKRNFLKLLDAAKW